MASPSPPPRPGRSWKRWLPPHTPSVGWGAMGGSGEPDRRRTHCSLRGAWTVGWPAPPSGSLALSPLIIPRLGWCGPTYIMSSRRIEAAARGLQEFVHPASPTRNTSLDHCGRLLCICFFGAGSCLSKRNLPLNVEVCTLSEGKSFETSITLF